MSDATFASQPTLSCRGVTVRFGGLTALDGVDLDARPGQITAVIGPNGAGKTTLFNAVTGMVPLAAGTVGLSGREVHGLATHQRGKAGIVRTFQNLEVFENMTVIENVMTGAHRALSYSMLEALLRLPRYFAQEAACRATARRFLDFVGLAGHEDAMAGDLAFGLQRLLELARALAAGPELLLLDEPAAGLNPRETRSLAEVIARVRDELGVTVALVEHDMDLVMGVADRITVLSFGKVLAEGTPAEVREDPAVIAAYLGEEDGEETAP